MQQELVQPCDGFRQMTNRNSRTFPRLPVLALISLWGKLSHIPSASIVSPVGGHTITCCDAFFHMVLECYIRAKVDRSV